MELIEADRSPAPAAPSADELAEFKAHVAEWVKIDEQVKKLRVATRERIVHQKAMTVHIQDFMKRFKYDDLNTHSGRIKHNVRDVKTPLKLTEVKSKLYDLADREFDEEVIKKIHHIFDGERPTVKKEALRRIVPRVSLSLDL